MLRSSVSKWMLNKFSTFSMVGTSERRSIGPSSEDSSKCVVPKWWCLRRIVGHSHSFGLSIRPGWILKLSRRKYQRDFWCGTIHWKRSTLSWKMSATLASNILKELRLGIYQGHRDCYSVLMWPSLRLTCARSVSVWFPTLCHGRPLRWLPTTLGWPSCFWRGSALAITPISSWSVFTQESTDLSGEILWDHCQEYTAGMSVTTESSVLEQLESHSDNFAGWDEEAGEEEEEALPDLPPHREDSIPHLRDRWVGPGIVVTSNNGTVYVGMRTRLWRCSPEQLRPALPGEL